MINLAQTIEKYKLGWVDGSIIQINPPSQKQYMTLQKLQTLPSQDSQEMIEALYEIVSTIINNNVTKKEYDCSILPFDSCLMIINDYFNFYQAQMEKNVVFLQSQQ